MSEPAVMEPLVSVGSEQVGHECMSQPEEIEACYRPWFEFQENLRAFLVRRTACAADADDLLHDIFLKIHHHLCGEKGPKEPRAWFFQVARNALTDYYRQRDVRNRLDRQDVTKEPLPTDDGSTRRAELAACIQPFIERLPEKYREAVKAVDVDGMSQKALAKRLGLSYSAAKSRVQRGRGQLIRLFSQCCELAFDQQGRVVDFNSDSRC